tara:strand:+ start:8256 stop:12773 length:4518 start_codon:yes stop_codon:yes gene_type:complete
MEDDIYTDADAWHKDVVKSYKSVGQRTITGSHSALLRDALKVRVANKKKANDMVGYRVFDKIIGEYLVTIEDRKVIDDRLQMLGEFLDIINKDELLTSKDPNPSKKGDKVKTRSGVDEQDAIKEAILVMSYKLNKSAPFGAVMGYITANFSDINPKDVAKKLGPIIASETASLKNKTKGDMLKMIKLEFPDAEVEEESKKSKEDTPKEEKINYYFGAGVYEPTELIYELSDGSEKTIDIKDIIKKIGHDKNAQKRLNQIKPNASLWPVSASGNYYLVISNDPVLVATKSTGRTWAGTSCENYNGAYNRGPYSDIEHGNAIVYIFKADKKTDGWPDKQNATLKGRTLLRWGNRDDEKGVFDIGVEKRVYPSNKVWGLQVATAIGLILKDSGFLKYKTRCRTPYIYKGWADTMGKNGVRINYTKLIMEGQSVDLDQAIFGPEMELAASPTISYSDCNRLSRQNVDIRIRRELAQNANIWNQDMALGRLIRSRDSMVCNLLAASPLAHPAALAAMAEQIAIIDPENYRNPLATNSLIFTIAKNPNSNVDVYDAIVKNHPGFINEQGQDVGSAEEILYLGLLSRKDISQTNWGRLSLAPAERMEQLIGEYLSYKANVGGTNRIKTRVNYAVNTGLINYQFNSGGAKIPLNFAKVFETVNMIQNVILSPYLSEGQFNMLIDVLKKLINQLNKTGKASPDTPDIYKDIISKIFSEVFFLDFREIDSWGFSSEFLVGDGASITLNANWIPNELKPLYSDFDRQNLKLLEFLMVLNSSKNKTDLQMIDMLTYWEKCLFNIEKGLQDGLIRDEGVVDYLWRRRAKLEIPSSAFTYRLRDSKNPLVPGEYIIDGRKLNIAFEELQGNEVVKFRFDFLPDSGRAVKTVRTEVSNELVNTILKKGKKELLNIGFDTVSNWLITPKQFNKFVDLTLATAIGNYYSEEDGTINPPYTEDEIFENPQLMEEHEDNLVYLNVLNTAAAGVNNFGGLCRNKNIPERTQSVLIKTWRDISRQFNGFYEEDYYYILESLSLNPITTPNNLNDLYLENKRLHEDIASNPNTPQKLLLYLYKDYPDKVLSNPSLSSANFTRLWYMTMDVLRTEVEIDMDRLYNLFRNNLQNLQTPLSGVKRRESYRKLLRENGNWLNYWRGGRVKAGSYSEFMNLNLWEDGGIADLPVPIMGKKFVMVNTPNRKKDSIEGTEIYFVDEMTGNRENLKVSGLVIKYNSDSGIWEEDKLDGRKKYTAQEFFNFIPPEERGGEMPLYFWDMSKFKTTDKQEMVEHINRYNENNGTDYSSDDINEGVKDADKWKVDNIFVFTDNKPPRGEKKVPVWRYSWDLENMETILKAFLSRMSYKEIKVLMKDWSVKYLVQGANISKERQAELSLRGIYINIDKNRLWTKELIDDALSDLFYNKGEIFLRMENMPLTKKLLSATLCETDEELEEQGIAGLVTLNDLNNIKMKVLSYPVVPIPYVYHILETTITPAVVNMAKNIRNQRPREFNQYLLDIAPEHHEDG